jgi:ribosomal protein S18 acetylase RimI-like enzyme
MGCMPVTLEPATVASLTEVADAVASWQQDGGPVQLHPGDLGWAWRVGGPELARDVRVWRADGQVVAVGLVDGDGLIRMGVAPSVDQDEQLASRLLADLSDPARGVLPTGNACVEARAGSALRGLLAARGWLDDESWTPLSRDLTDAVEACELRVEVGTAHDAATLASDRESDRMSDRVSDWVSDRVEVQRASFESSTFTASRWHLMAAASPYKRARCLVGYDRDGTAVATVTVWSAGPGRPGLLEPLGVHRDHRGRRYGTAISLAAAAALREMGASSATVCTPSSNVVGVATYVSAGFRALPAVTDFRRPS